MGRRRKSKGGGLAPRHANDPRRHIAEMRAAFPNFTHRLGRDRTVTWEGTFQPNPSSQAYRIKVLYQRRGTPRVFVLDPPLPEKAPHVWPDGSLCLYWWKEWRWNDSEPMAETIMLWAALWLEYFEIWQQVGDWLGPSSHGEPRKVRDDD